MRKIPTAGSIRVSNLRADMAPDAQPEDHEVVIRVDRANPVLGNPHRMRAKTQQERARVIQAYEQTLARDIAMRGPMSRAVEDIANVVRQGREVCLQCWCFPLPCHGDVIAAEVRRRVTEPATGATPA